MCLALLPPCCRKDAAHHGEHLPVLQQQLVPWDAPSPWAAAEESQGDLPEPRYLIPEALHRLWGEEETRPYCLLFGLLVKKA